MICPGYGSESVPILKVRQVHRLIRPQKRPYQWFLVCIGWKR